MTLHRIKTGFKLLCAASLLSVALNAQAEDLQQEMQQPRQDAVSLWPASKKSFPDSEKKVPEKDLTAQASKSKGSSNIENSWKPYWKHNCYFQQTPLYFNSVSLGIGFLRFSGQKGGAAVNLQTTVLKTNVPHWQGGTGYNRTPLVDATVGWNPLSWMGIAMAYVGQHNVIFQRFFWDTTTDNGMSIGVFRANVDLNALAAKAYFYLPYSMIWKTVAYSPYLVFGVGPAWQTWSPFYNNLDSTTALNFWRQKVSANCFFMTDIGFQMRSLIPDINFSVVTGVKFNIWGQARNMGQYNQQAYRTSSSTPANNPDHMLQPWSIKTVYQFAPYIGFMWTY